MNELAKATPRNIITTFDDAERAAAAMAGSGFFQDARQASQAIVKILAGQELGFGPFASMTGVAIIQGKPAIGANLQAAAVKRTGKYNYRVIEMTNEACELEFYEGGQAVGKSRFDMKDAAAANLAGKDNWKKFPRNMLFARAISNGIKWYAPDIFNGATVYTPDELGAIEDEEGRAISQPPPAEVIEGQAEEVAAPETAARFDAETLRKKIKTTADAAALDGKATCTDGDRKVLAAALGKIFKDSTMRYEFSQYLTGESSTKKMSAEYVNALMKWLGNGNAQSVNFDYAPPAFIVAEANAAHTAALVAAGQQALI